jgi:TPR repeat protein
MALFDKGCKQGEKYGCVNLGRTFQKKGNKPEAKAAYKKACELGDAEACAKFKEE